MASTVHQPFFSLSTVDGCAQLIMGHTVIFFPSQQTQRKSSESRKKTHAEIQNFNKIQSEGRFKGTTNPSDECIQQICAYFSQLNFKFIYLMTHKRYQFVCQETRKKNEMYTDYTEVEQKTLCVAVVFTANSLVLLGIHHRMCPLYLFADSF